MEGEHYRCHKMESVEVILGQMMTIQNAPTMMVISHVDVMLDSPVMVSRARTLTNAMISPPAI